MRKPVRRCAQAVHRQIQKNVRHGRIGGNAQALHPRRALLLKEIHHISQAAPHQSGQHAAALRLPRHGQPRHDVRPGPGLRVQKTALPHNVRRVFFFSIAGKDNGAPVHRRCAQVHSQSQWNGLFCRHVGLTVGQAARHDACRAACRNFSRTAAARRVRHMVPHFRGGNIFRARRRGHAFLWKLQREPFSVRHLTAARQTPARSQFTGGKNVRFGGQGRGSVCHKAHPAPAAAAKSAAQGLRRRLPGKPDGLRKALARRSLYFKGFCVRVFPRGCGGSGGKKNL